MTHPACLPTDVLLSDCEIKKTRRGGPGGQHRNKVETAIVISHLPSGIIAQASEKRSQFENRKVAIERLRLNLAVGVRTLIDVDQQPSRRWLSRVKNRKISVSSKHPDLPCLIAEALNVVKLAEFDVPNAAERLGVSTSQLVKLIKLALPAFEWLNAERNKLGMGPMK